jgi:Lamin Tail Domain
MNRHATPLIVLLATTAIGALPCSAQVEQDTGIANPTQHASTLTSHLAAGEIARGLELRGEPLGRTLLLVGHPLPGAQSSSAQRVSPTGTVWLELDATGRQRFALAASAQPVFAQTWTPPVPGAASPAGTWSDLVVSFPESLAGGVLASTASPGDLIVTEFLKDPTDVSDSSGEWIEVRNTLPWRLDIDGVVLSDTSGASFVFDGGGTPLYLRPNESFVIGANADSALNGGVTVDWEWSGFSLKNSNDEIILHDRFGALLDSVSYDDGVLWPDTPGMSISLRASATDAAMNDDATNWCHSSSLIGAGNDTGTPGALNDLCP